MPLVLTKDQLAQLKEIFELFDTNKDGQIDRTEMKNALTKLGCPEE